MPSPCFLPAGMELAFAGPAANIPAGWLASDGSAVGRSTYARLFAAIGTTWGVGDGSTTFNLPDRRGRFLKGVNATNPGNTGGATLHTPAGTNNAPAFTGAAATLTGSTSAPAFTGTPATLTGSIPAPVISWPVSVPVFAGTNFSLSAGGTGGVTSFVKDLKPAGTLTWPATKPTNATPVLTMDSYTPAGTVAAPTLTMNSYTPTGSVAAPTFTGASANFEPQWGDTIWLIKI